MRETFQFVLNGRAVQVDAPADRPLLSVLRDSLGLRATRYGCGQEQCGACMVLIDAEPVPSCTRPVDSVAGRSVTTVEGLAALQALQSAFVEEQAGQCGYCLSGILVAAAALLARNMRPSRAEVASALDANLCRCGAHNRIISAVRKAGALLAEGRAP